jgi:hypothetical protein
MGRAGETTRQWRERFEHPATFLAQRKYQLPQCLSVKYKLLQLQDRLTFLRRAGF